MPNFTPPSPASGETGSAAKLISVIVIIAVIIIGVYYWYALRRPAAPSEDAGALTAADLPDLSATDSNLSENVTPANTTESVPNLNPTDSTNPFKDAYQNPFQ